MEKRKLIFLLLFYVVLLPVYSYAEQSKQETQSNLLSFDLKDVDIISTSKEKEPAFKAASSAYVVTSDDIRRRERS